MSADDVTDVTDVTKGGRSPVAWVKLNSDGGIDLVLDDGLLDHQGRLALHCDLEGPIPLYTAA